MTVTAEVSARKANGRAPTPVLELLDGAIAQIPLTSIDLGPNVRVDVGELEDLVASVKEHGVLQPIKVKPVGDRFEVVWGQRRFLAAKRAGQERISALIELEVKTAPATAIEQLVENLQRADLNPIDEAKALRQVLDADKDLTQEALAAKLGRSAPWLSNSLRMLEAAPGVQKLLAAGSLSSGHVKAVAGLPAAKQTELATRAAKQGTSAHELEREAKWARDDVKRQESDRNRLEKIAKSAIAQLEKVAKKDALIVVDAGIVWQQIKAAGWTNRHEGNRWSVDVVNNAGECGCAAWVVEYDNYGSKTDAKVKPVCANDKHKAKRQREALAKHDRESAVREAAQQARSASRAADVDAIVKALRIRLEELPFAVCKVLLRSLMEGNWDFAREFNKRRGGKDGYEVKPATVEALTGADALDELCVLLATKVVGPDVTWQAEKHDPIRLAMLEAIGKPAEAAS